MKGKNFALVFEKSLFVNTSHKRQTFLGMSAVWHKFAMLQGNGHDFAAAKRNEDVNHIHKKENKNE